MKYFTLSSSILIGFTILIVAFQNLGAKTQYFLLLLFSVDNVSPFFIILIISFLGAVAGMLYTLTVLEFAKGTGSDDSNDDNL